MKNKNLNEAKKNKRDEFYTKLKDIEEELSHYRRHFKNKKIYINCDNPKISNFWTFFYENFKLLNLKKLTATYFEKDKKPIKYEYNGKNIKETSMQGDGDFRSPECIAILKDSDVIVTNPPFSLFRDFIDLLTEHNKKFLIIGSINAVVYKNVFPLIRENKIWLGCKSGAMSFYVPNRQEYENSDYHHIDEYGRSCRKFGNITWFTNLKKDAENEVLELTEEYSPLKYPKYDNYDAIEVKRITKIPKDYYGVMGVPISFLSKHNPSQFQILGLAGGSTDKNVLGIEKIKKGESRTMLKGKVTYARIFIRRV